MNNRVTSTRSIVEAGLNAALIAVIMLLNAYVPAFALIGTFILSIPITVLYIRYDYKVTLGSIFVSAVLIAFLVSPFSALTGSVVYGITGITLGYCIKRDMKISGMLGMLTIASAIGMFLTYYVFSYFLFKNGVVGILNMIEKSAATSKSMVATIYKQSGLTEAQVQQVLRVFDFLTVDKMLIILPGLLLICSFFSAYINYILTRSILKRLKYEMREMKPFSLIFMDNRIGALIIIIACIGIILSSRKLLVGQYILAAANVVLSVSFSLIGASVVTYYLKNKYKLAKGLTAIIVIFGILSPLAGVFMYIGLADMIFDFRKLDPNRLLRVRKKE